MSTDIEAYLGDRPNNWQPDLRHMDLIECCRCGQLVPPELLDDDASEAFEGVCRECAEQEREQAQAEDAKWQAEQGQADRARAIRLAFSNWWLGHGRPQWHDLLQLSLKRHQTLEEAVAEMAETAWLAGAVEAVKQEGGLR